MAASSGDDILAQLAALLGRESVCHIRKTDTAPPQVNVIDVAAAITGKSHDAAAQDFRRMTKKCLGISAKCTDVTSPDARGRQGQRKTKVGDVRGHLGTSWVWFTSTSLSFAFFHLFPLLLPKN